MRRFGTQSPVNPQEHYVVSRFTMTHFSKEHAQLLEEDNVDLTHLFTNI